MSRLAHTPRGSGLLWDWSDGNPQTPIWAPHTLHNICRWPALDSSFLQHFLRCTWQIILERFDCLRVIFGKINAINTTTRFGTETRLCDITNRQTQTGESKCSIYYNAAFIKIKQFLMWSSQFRSEEADMAFRRVRCDSFLSTHVTTEGSFLNTCSTVLRSLRGMDLLGFVCEHVKWGN